MKHFILFNSKVLSIFTLSLMTYAPAQAETCISNSDFPLIPSHYDAATGGSNPGKNDAIKNSDGSFKNVQSSSYIYPTKLMPNYAKYIGSNYSTVLMSNSEVCSWTQRMETLTGYKVNVVRPGSWSDTTIAKSSLASGSEAFQVLPQLIYGQNLYTIILPPGWSPNDPVGSYSIIFNGQYSLKEALTGVYSESVPYILKGMSDAINRNPNIKAIAVIWNGGGEVGSYTTNSNELFYVGVSGILSQAEIFGGAKSRLFTIGHSRGGITSLRIAAKYKAVAAIAGMPATAIGEVSNMTSSTVPGLYSYSGLWTTGIKSSWKANWTYPSGLGRSELTGSSLKQSQLYILTGTKSPNIANNMDASPRATVSTLKANNTNVFLQISSHDYLVPWIDQFRYLKKLQATGVRFEAVINYMAGHFSDPEILTNQLSTALTRFQDGLSPVAVSGKTVRRGIASGQFSVLNTNKDLFTIELPRLISPSLKGNIHVTGIPGTIWRLELTPNGYVSSVVVEYTIGADGTNLIPIDSLPFGKLILNNITFMEPGTSSFVQVNRATTTAEHAVDIRDTDPAVTSVGPTSAITLGYIGASGELANLGCGASIRCTGVTYGYSYY